MIDGQGPIQKGGDVGGQVEFPGHPEINDVAGDGRLDGGPQRVGMRRNPFLHFRIDPQGLPDAAALQVPVGIGRARRPGDDPIDVLGDDGRGDVERMRPQDGGDLVQKGLQAARITRRPPGGLDRLVQKTRITFGGGAHEV